MNMIIIIIIIISSSSSSGVIRLLLPAERSSCAAQRVYKGQPCAAWPSRRDFLARPAPHWSPSEEGGGGACAACAGRDEKAFGQSL